MAQAKTKLIGNCQHCGRQHAVQKGRVAQHGYTVDDGVFTGVCSGNLYAPMQAEITETNKRVDFMLALAATKRAEAKAYETGEIKIETITRRVLNRETYRMEDVTTTVDENTPARLVETATATRVFNLNQMARTIEAQAEALQKLANKVHGQPLKEEAKAAPVAAITVGEQRFFDSTRIATVLNVSGSEVRINVPSSTGDKTFIVSTRKFRAMKPA